VTGDLQSDLDGAKGHLHECVACSRAAELTLAGERVLAESLDAEVPQRTSDEVAQTSWIRVRRMRVRRWIIVGAIAAAVATFGLLGRFAMPEVRRLIAPPPPVVTATFSLACLSSEQAAMLLRPYLPIPQNPRWQAESFSVSPAPDGIRAVTIRAPQETIDRVPALLTRFENDRGAACRR
jgi:hypothetical protein